MVEAAAVLRRGLRGAAGLRVKTTARTRPSPGAAPRGRAIGWRRRRRGMARGRPRASCLSVTAPAFLCFVWHTCQSEHLVDGAAPGTRARRPRRGTWRSAPVARRLARTCRRCRRSARRRRSLAAPPRLACRRPRSHPCSRPRRPRQCLGRCGRLRAGSWADARPARPLCRHSTIRPTACPRAAAITGASSQVAVMLRQRPASHLAGWRPSARRRRHRHLTARRRGSPRACARSTPA